MMFILRLTVIFEVLKTVLSSGFVLMNLTSSEFVMLKLRRLDSQPLSYKLKGNKSLITLPEGKHRLIEFPLAWNDTLSLGFDVFNAEGGLLISLEMHRRPNPHGSDWQKDVFSAKNARIQAVYRYECDKYGFNQIFRFPRLPSGTSTAKNAKSSARTVCICRTSSVTLMENWTARRVGLEQSARLKLTPPTASAKTMGFASVKTRISRKLNNKSGLKKMPRCHHIHEDLMEQFLSNHRNQSTEHPFQNLPTKPRSCL
ncbi:hypothetical protein WR25_13903 isoform E [Diploscapter pachys]|uniref:Uncharacterized protein n=1 Tax=Diploscapter pachys TaxID=2018661 RepID=A0A2A2K525_9BILA|nr:hypothetical protein WR25_13903 isoform C [Diploscapter pachys]PAV68992.1 hypothetical protein WR25_13903 isoform E [Diploscapter pachys]